ncbi:MAG: PKD domain-containing protein, partial [Chloroflexi bacterium]
SSQPDVDIEPDYENNLSSYLLNVGMPAFEVSKEYTGSRVAGTEIDYSITITNTGNYASTTVHLIDILPGEFTYIEGAGTYSAGKVEWTIPEIEPSESVERSFHGTLSCEVGTVVINEHYRVDDSVQGAVTQDGDPVSFSIIAPTISAGFNVSDSSVEPGGTVSFSNSSSTNGTNLTYTWNFGDGGSASGTTANHTLKEPGVYEVTLTATDGCGFSDTEVKTITVKELKLFLPLVVK